MFQGAPRLWIWFAHIFPGAAFLSLTNESTSNECCVLQCIAMRTLDTHFTIATFLGKDLILSGIIPLNHRHSLTARKGRHLSCVALISCMVPFLADTLLAQYSMTFFTKASACQRISTLDASCFSNLAMPFFNLYSNRSELSRRTRGLQQVEAGCKFVLEVAMLPHVATCCH